ncbi:hypothetical protein GEMRC1_013255 [Eukaryota sp. GEM-RC1]
MVYTWRRPGDLSSSGTDDEAVWRYLCTKPQYNTMDAATKSFQRINFTKSNVDPPERIGKFLNAAIKAIQRSTTIKGIGEERIAMPSDLIADHLIQIVDCDNNINLLEDLKMKWLRVLERKPEMLDEFVNDLKEVYLFWARNNSVQTDERSSRSSKPSKNALKKARKPTRSNLNENQRSDERPSRREERACFNCNKKSHLSKDCKAPPFHKAVASGDSEEHIVLEILDRYDTPDGEHCTVLWNGGETSSVPTKDISNTKAYSAFIKLESIDSKVHKPKKPLPRTRVSSSGLSSKTHVAKRTRNSKREKR